MFSLPKKIIVLAVLPVIVFLAFIGGYIISQKCCGFLKFKNSSVSTHSESNIYIKINELMGDGIKDFITWNDISKNWQFMYITDGELLRDVPIPGVEDLVAATAVKAYYFNSNGREDSILIATSLRLTENSYIYISDFNNPLSKKSLETFIEEYPGAFQVYKPGLIAGAVLVMNVDEYGNASGGSVSEFTQLLAVQKYLEYVSNNKISLERFLETGHHEDLNIIFPISLIGNGNTLF